ncbi:MAG: hypothetical protein CSA72_13755 [Rhodobacterales bacterium]|nr:MAG: hypothetical protein CSA72_13755 [Rhodobacterales bacterium]
MTELDRAAQALAAAPQDDAARLALFERISDSELYLALEAEPAPGEESVRPLLFDVDGARFALVFDRAGRLTDFAEGAAPYVALSGRAVAAMLAGQGIGLALNPEVAPSSMLISAEEIDWLAVQLAGAPEEAEARLSEIAPPPALPEHLIAALDRKLATAAGRARHAWLVEARKENGVHGALLVFVDPAPGAEWALARLVQEALTFSGLEAGAIDVGFSPSSGPMAAQLAKVGLRFDLPEVAREDLRPAPGSDPENPPILR